MDTEARSWVWVPNKTEVFKKGCIVETEDEDKVRVRFENGQDEVIESSQISEVNPSKFDKADDIAELTFLNEPSVLHNLEARYKDDLIYTYSGLFLVAVNPYSTLPIYTDDYINMYHNVPKADTKPHIFAETEAAYQNLLEEKRNQSILVTGESGAGKTENTKKILSYLAAITASHHQDKESFEQQIIQANPIIEAFGNSQTVRNNNSSRFGKFIKVEFNDQGKIAGAHIDWYLLEKSRVVHHSKNERNYHIFYQIIAGLSDTEMKELGLNRSVSDYEYLKYGNISIPGVNDVKEFQALKSALDIMGIEETKYKEIFKILAIILHIGNIEFQSIKAEQARFQSSVDKLCELLGVSVSDFSESILSPKTKAGREVVKQSKNATQAKYALDALSKSLYEKIFKFLVDSINERLDRDSLSSNFIGVLDIAGFEIFKENSFEQLCINYTNEKLQQFFNHHMFVLEQNEYIREDIEWDFIDFGQDLQQTIDLIEKHKPLGIFSILDEECIVPKSTDKSFFEKLNNYCNSNPEKFKPSRFTNKFTLTHYAGNVEYSVDGWIGKNRDPLSDNVLEILSNSSTPFVAQLYQQEVQERSSSFTTVAQKHKDQLADLLNLLSETHPHFVRCIIPNHKKKPQMFDKPLVLEQLKCNGVLEGIRIVRSGFPNRIFFKEFFTRYKVLAKETDFNHPLKANCQTILESLDLSPVVYKVGSTKVFFKAGILAELELRRDQEMKKIITEFKAICKGVTKRRFIKKELLKVQASQVIKKAFDSYNQLSKNPWFVLHSNLKPMLSSLSEDLKTQQFADQIRSLEDQLSATAKERDLVLEQHSVSKSELQKVSDLLQSKRSAIEANLLKIEESNSREIELAKKLEDTEAQIKSLETESKKSDKLNVDLQAKVEKHKLELEDCKKLSNDLQMEKQTLLSKISILEKSLKDVEITQNRNVEDGKVMEEELAMLKSVAISKNMEIKKLEEKLFSRQNELEAQINDLESNYSVASKRIKELVAENKELNLSLKPLQELSKEYQTFLTRKESDHKTLQSQLKERSLRIKQLENERDSLKATESGISNKLTNAEKQLKDLFAKHRQLEHEAKESRDLLQHKIHDDIAFNRGKPTFDNEMSALKSSVESLRREIYQEKTKSLNLAKQLTTAKRENEELLRERKTTDVKNAQGALRSRSINSNYESDLDHIKDDNEQLIKEYTNMKYQLNEKSAVLTNQTVENRKLKNELELLERKLASETFEKQQIKIKMKQIFSMNNIPYDNDLGILNDTNDENAFPDGNRCYSLSPQMTSGEGFQRKPLSNRNSLESSNRDFKSLYENSEAKIRFLERQLSSRSDDQILRNNAAQQSHTPGREHQDLLQVYHQTSKNLQDTLSQLSLFKSENTSLKKEITDQERIIRDYQSKKEEDLSNHLVREDLVKAQLKLEAIEKKNCDLSKSVKLYRERADEHYKKLEEAEQVVKSTKYTQRHLKDQLAQSNETLVNLKAENDDTTAQLAKLRSTVASLEAQLDEKLTDISKLESSNMLLKEEIQHYHERLVSNNSTENERYKKKVAALDEKLSDSLREETELRKGVASLEIELERIKTQTSQQISELKKEATYHKKLSVDIKEENRRVLAEQKDLESKLRSLMTQIGSLKNSVDSLIEERNSLKTDKVRLEDQVQTFTKEYAKFGDDRESTQTTISALREQIATYQGEIGALQMESKKSLESQNKLHLIINDEKQKNIILVEENQSLGKFAEGLKQGVSELEEKLAVNNDEIWLERISKLESKLQEEASKRLDAEEQQKFSEKYLVELRQRTDENNRIIKEFDDERSKYEDKIHELLDAIEQWQSADSTSKLNIKRAEREINYLKEHSDDLEAELKEWQQKFESLSTRYTIDVDKEELFI